MNTENKDIKLGKSYKAKYYLHISENSDIPTDRETFNIIYKTNIKFINKRLLDFIYFNGTIANDYYPLTSHHREDVTTTNPLYKGELRFITESHITSIDYHRQYILNYFKLNNLTYNENLTIYYYDIRK